MKKIIEFLKNSMRKIIFRIKLKQMDDWWYFMGGSCFELFPPSFYYTHTEEEIERITAENLERIDKLINELD